MGTPFKIPKKKQPSDSCIIRMTSPLSRLQDDVTAKPPWNRDPANKLNGSSYVNGRRETKPASFGADRWRPKRGSDKLCRRKDDTHTPAAKKQWGPPGLAERCTSSQPGDESEKTAASPVRETKSAPAQSVSKVSPPSMLARTLKETNVQSGDCPSTRSKLQLRLSFQTSQRVKGSCPEPIVLSSGDEDEGEDEAHRDARLSPDLPKNQNSLSGGQSSSPAIMELAFSSLYFSATQSHANGPIMITEEGILIPLKVVSHQTGSDIPYSSGSDGECVSVSVVPSELRAYGVWDDAGSGLTELCSSSSSLLFFILSNPQAQLLHVELSALHKHTAVPPCPFVLVHLVGQLDDLQQATLASLMEMMALRSGHPALGTRLSRDEGLKRVLCHPRGAQFLTMLGNKATNQENRNGSKSGKAPEVTNTRHTLRSHTKQPTLPRRLIQYPPPPSKGGITVTTEDLECLRDGEFLNDVIIDFYLKYLQLERADRDIADRSHIFSSFFYKQLTRRANNSEEEAGGTAQYRRHGRVRTWTRNVDIFSKDYLFIPVNQDPLVPSTDLFPGPAAARVRALEEKFNSSGDLKGKSENSTHKSSNLPDCTVLACQRNIVTKRPCILIMDSLKLTYHYRIYALLREYLQVEWEVRRGTPRMFDNDSIKGSHCKVPLQDNSSDCGLYLLQYVESFLQNPVVHFDIPLRLEHWFPRQQVRRKRTELRELVLQLYQEQVGNLAADTICKNILDQ